MVHTLGNDPALETKLYFEMLRIRSIEEAIADRYSEQEMRCPVHLSIGQEAVAVGVCEALSPQDYALSGHRNHAHYLAKGGDLRAMLAELYGKATGCSRGVGGSMHLSDLAAGFIGATPIVGSTVPIAVGAALNSQMRSENRVVAIFFGDGAMEAGVVHESLNFASQKALPVLFVCENNLYSVYSGLGVRQPLNRAIVDVAKSHGIFSHQSTGNDVKKVLETAEAAIRHIKEERGPAFIEFSTYRWREHCGPNYDNDIGYRSEQEFEEWQKNDPVLIQRDGLAKLNVFVEYDKLAGEIQEEIDDAFEFAKSSAFPNLDSALADLYG